MSLARNECMCALLMTSFVRVVFQCLSYKGFLTVHWEEMERQGKAMLDFDKDGKTDSDDMKFLYRKGMGIVATV